MNVIFDVVAADRGNTAQVQRLVLIYNYIVQILSGWYKLLSARRHNVNLSIVSLAVELVLLKIRVSIEVGTTLELLDLFGERSVEAQLRVVLELVRIIGLIVYFEVGMERLAWYAKWYAHLVKDHAAREFVEERTLEEEIAIAWVEVDVPADCLDDVVG